MNLKQARELAKSKWGVLGFAMISKYDGNKLVGKRIVIKIKNKQELVNDYYGEAKTWKQAFEKASKKGY